MYLIFSKFSSVLCVFSKSLFDLPFLGRGNVSKFSSRGVKRGVHLIKRILRSLPSTLENVGLPSGTPYKSAPCTGAVATLDAPSLTLGAAYLQTQPRQPSVVALDVDQSLQQPSVPPRLPQQSGSMHPMHHQYSTLLVLAQ